MRTAWDDEKKAYAALKSGAFESAAELFEELLEKYPDLTDNKKLEFIRQAGSCYEHLFNISRILSLLDRYKDSFPPNSVYGLYLKSVSSYYLILLGDYKKAIKEVKGIYEKLRPTSEMRIYALAQRVMGMAYTYLGETEKAKEHLESSFYIFRRIKDTDKSLASLTMLAYLYDIYSMWDVALKHRKTVLRTAKKEKSEKWEIPALINLSISYINLGKWSWAEMVLKKVMALLEEIENPESLLLADAKINLAHIHIKQRRYKSAQQLLFAAFDYVSSVNAKRQLYLINKHLGQIEYEKGNYQSALESYFRAYNIVKEIAPKGNWSAEIQRLIAECYIMTNRLKEVLPFLRNALKLSRSVKNKFFEALTYRVFAKVYDIQNNVDSAIYYYEKSIELLEEIAELYERGRTLLEYGKFLSRQGNYFRALRLLYKAEDLFKKLPSEYWIAATYLAIAENYYRTNNHDLALKYLDMSWNIFYNLHEKESLIEAQKLRKKIEEGMLEYALLRANEFTVPDESLEKMLSFLHRKLSLRSLLLLAERNGSFEILKEIGAHPALREYVTLSLNRRNLRKPLLSSRADKQKRIAFLKKEGISSFLFLPLSHLGNKTILYLDKKDQLKQEELLFIVRFSGALSVKLSELEQKELKRQNLQLIRELRKREFPNIITKNEKMLRIFDLIEKIKDDNIPVLIEGESGTGKELIAKAIHHRGKRGSKPFVPQDCGALPEGLAESILFGHRKGAFTGAINDCPGLFEEANNGTLFLDEISNLSPSIQAKLLRVLQDGMIRRLGERRLRKVNVRVIAASNVDLDEAVKKGKFRKDLLYRLKGIRIKLPPLRERKEDIPLLVHYFVSKYSREKGKKVKKITKEAMDALMAYDWENNNIRELEFEIESAIIRMENGVITPDLFSFQKKPKKMKPSPTIDEILEALKENNWIIRRTAKFLKMPESTLRKRLKTHGIRPAAVARRNM